MNESYLEAVAVAFQECHHWMGGVGVYRRPNGDYIALSPLVAKDWNEDICLVLEQFSDLRDILGPEAPAHPTQEEAKELARIWLEEFAGREGWDGI
mgnify:CR=1 FL=1